MVSRVPAVHVCVARDTFVTRAFWHELRITGSDPLRAAQNANASVQFIRCVVFQYTVALHVVVGAPVVWADVVGARVVGADVVGAPVVFWQKAALGSHAMPQTAASNITTSF